MNDKMWYMECDHCHVFSNYGRPKKKEAIVSWYNMGYNSKRKLIDFIIVLEEEMILLY
jgi:hypothetical protein